MRKKVWKQCSLIFCEKEWLTGTHNALRMMNVYYSVVLTENDYLVRKHDFPLEDLLVSNSKQFFCRECLEKVIFGRITYFGYFIYNGEEYINAEKVNEFIAKRMLEHECECKE